MVQIITESELPDIGTSRYFNLVARVDGVDDDSQTRDENSADAQNEDCSACNAACTKWLSMLLAILLAAIRNA